MSPSGRATITRQELARDFERAGLCAGDVIIMHSSLGRIGWVPGGPRDVVMALREVVGPGGTIIMPTFTFSLEGWGLPPFNPASTPSRVGTVTEHFWRLPGVLRSGHPTHSIAAWGPQAHHVIGQTIDYEPLGIGSPLDRARQLGAKILLAGVTQNRNSTIHLAESIAAMPYLRVPFTVDADHEVARYHHPVEKKVCNLVIQEVPGSSEGFDVLDDMLLREAVSTRVRVGHTDGYIMLSEDLCRVVSQWLREQPLLLLQPPNPSEITVRRRVFMEALLSGEARGI